MRTDITSRPPGLKLGYHHFAFFRGSLDGMSLAVLADRYLEDGDARRAGKTLDWIRNELIAAARRHQRETGLTGSSFVRLLALKPIPLSVTDKLALAEIPSLEDFQADIDPAGFYSEAELVREFETRYGGGAGPTAPALRKVEQNERLRRRLRQAIDLLEGWLATTPKPLDPLSIWIDPVVVAPLVAVGITSIHALVSLINDRGHLWYRKIPRCGAIRAARVVRWLQLNQVLPLEQRALVPYRRMAPLLPSLRRKETAIVPLEHLILPAMLDGSMGTNRSHECLISASNDLEAIHAWIDLRGDNKNTRRAYTIQAERLLLWITLEKGRALSSTTPEDCQEYMKFMEALATPGAEWRWQTVRGHWIGSKTKRWSPDWRPFTGDLSAASRKMAVTILKGLFAWLVASRYLRNDPWTPVKVPRDNGRTIHVDHALNVRQWTAVCDELEDTKTYINDPAEDERYCRLRFILWLGYTGGLRLEEMLDLNAGNLMRLPESDWWLRFRGKGGKEREIPLVDAVFAFLQEYMESKGQGVLPHQWARELPLITTLGNPRKERNRLSEASLYQMLKVHFAVAAERIDDMIDADTLRRASTHWLRHTAATNMINNGAQVSAVQDILGHASASTTALYAHADRKLKRDAVLRGMR